MEQFQTIVTPQRYSNLVDDDSIPYNLYGTYKITNPSANENNHYIQRRKVNRAAIKPTATLQYIVENARDNSEELLYYKTHHQPV